MLKAFSIEVRFLRARRPDVSSREAIDEPQSISLGALGLDLEENDKVYHSSDLSTACCCKCGVIES